MGFKGGYSFKRFEGVGEPVLRECAIPDTVYLSKTGDGQWDVSEGDTVRAGVVLIQNEANIVISPVNGKVTATEGNLLTIASDGSPEYTPVDGHPREPWLLNKEDILKSFRASGCSGLLNIPVNTSEDSDSIKHIIVNAVHNSPVNQAWNPLMTGDSSLFADGLKTIKALFPNADITIAINRRNKKFFDSTEISVSARPQVMSDRYPQEREELLARDILGMQLISPEGKCDDSIMTIPFLSVIQIAEGMTQGKPLMDKILLIAGPGVSRPGWYRVRIGTPITELKRQLFKSDAAEPLRIIHGDLFTGQSMLDEKSSILPSDTEINVIWEQTAREMFRFATPGFRMDSYPKSTVAEFVPLLSKRLDSGVHGGVRPCVQCNYCDEVCPVGIYPHIIWKNVEAGTIDESLRFRPQRCIGCGLCDYVCPSKIDISPAVKKARDTYYSQRRRDEQTD